MRTVLLIAFGGMLVLMAVAGADALWTLHQLHEQDASTRGTWLRRGRSISQLRLSVRLYEDCARHWLMSPESPQRQEDSSGNPSDASPERLAQLAAQIHSVLQSFPEPRDKTEQALLRSFERAVAEHQKALTGTLGWKPDEIRRRGPEIMTMVVNPRQIEILELTDGMDSVNVGWLAAQDQNLLRQFEALRRRLTRLLIIALGAGLILAVGSLAYILRLEKDAERRYGEIVRNHAEMEKLSARLVDAQEQERRALSRELHDEVGQSLGALLVDLSRAAALVPADDERLKTELANLKATTEGALRSVRDIALLLRPSMLDDLGLIPALE
jgi:signal transduction histidine kinase